MRARVGEQRRKWKVTFFTDNGEGGGVPVDEDGVASCAAPCADASSQSALRVSSTRVLRRTCFVHSQDSLVCRTRVVVTVVVLLLVLMALMVLAMALVMMMPLLLLPRQANRT
jgi:hypothetical protein